MNVTRLGQMSVAEIAHRIREQFRRHADKVQFRAQLQRDYDPELEVLIQRNASSLKSYLRSGPARRFYASTRDRERTATFIEQRYPEWIDRAIAKADVLCEHRVTLFGRDVHLGADIDWHRDPMSGFQWQRRYWTEYDLINMPPADAKVIHELNRQQHLPRLAKAFFLTGNERYASEAIAQIESWIDQNPKWDGVNWQSSLEIGIRSVSWIWTIFLALESQYLEEEKLRRICRSLFAQLDHVYRYPSLYTSPNTHLIGEAASLFIAGVLFPEIPRAGTWRSFGERTLINEAARQVLNDGVYGELSSYYHCYAADFYLHVLALARANRISLPDRLWDGLSRMLDFVMHLTRPDGTIPLFGDDDGGRVLALDSENYASYRDGLCSGCILFGRPDFKHQSGAFCEESLWLLGDEASRTFDSITAERPTALHRAFDKAGYFIQRSGWDAKDTHITFDCGGLGFGNGGHSHADALSFTVFSGGHEFLIDPGTSVYNGAPGWRRFFRSTAAHNTVVLDDRGQCEPGASFRWKTKTSSHLRQHFALPDIDYIDGALEFRDGGKSWASILPRSRNGGIIHRRRLVYIRPNYWIVLDNLDGRGEHDFDFLYHFAPNAQLTVVSDERHGEIDCRVQIDQAGLQLCMYASEAMQAEAICGQRRPIQGWASRIYGEHHASPVLKASIHANAPVSMMSFLCPGNEPIRSRRFKSNTSRAIAAVMRDGDYDDIAVMAAEDGDLRLIDYVMNGEFFWMRLEQGNLRRLLAVNAHFFSCAGEIVFESEQVIPYVQVCFWENGILIERGEQEGRVYVRDLRDSQFQRN